MMFSRPNLFLAAVVLVALVGVVNGRAVARASTVRGLRGEKGFKTAVGHPQRQLKMNVATSGEEEVASGDLGGKEEVVDPSTEDVMVSMDSDPSEAPMSVDDSMASSADKGAAASGSAPSKKSASSGGKSGSKLAKSGKSKSASQDVSSGKSSAQKSKKSASGGSSGSGSKAMKMSKVSKSSSNKMSSGGKGGSSGPSGAMASTDAAASMDEEEDVSEESNLPPTNEDSPLYYPAPAIADACENYAPNPDIEVSRCEAVCEAGACCFATEEGDDCPAVCESYEPCEVLYA